MDPQEVIAQLQQDVVNTKTELKGSEEKISTLEAKLAEQATQLETNKSEFEAVSAKLAETEVALQTASDSKTELEAQIKELTEKVVTFEAAQEEALKVARLETRLAELPEVVRANLEEHPEKDVVTAKWREATDEEWDVVKQSFELAASGTDYVAASDRERGVNGKGHSTTGGSGLSKFIRA